MPSTKEDHFGREEGWQTLLQRSLGNLTSLVTSSNLRSARGHYRLSKQRHSRPNGQERPSGGRQMRNDWRFAPLLKSSQLLLKCPVGQGHARVSPQMLQPFCGDEVFDVS
jgi:hypothetical protein